VKLVAIMSFFDEQPAFLTAAVSSMALAEVDHLVAIDGPYALYPDSMRRARSNLEQTAAIVGAAHGIGVGLTLHTPNRPWLGNEIEKRNALFDIARVALPDLTSDDWFVIVDSDEYIEKGAGTKAALAEAFEDVAYYQLLEPDGSPNHVRALYRWHPELCLTKTHYGFRHGVDGQLLWDGGGMPAAVLVDTLVLRHMERDSMSARFRNKWEYYRAREDSQIERVP
jgi:hypothetical protein